MTISLIEMVKNHQKTLEKFQKDLRLGFELELCGLSCNDVYYNPIWPSNIYKELFRSPTIDDNWWGMGRDGSIPDPGLELRSPVNAPTEDIIKVIKAMRKMGCKVGQTCGFHIHVSHPSKAIGINIKEEIEFWNSRKKWVGGNPLDYRKIPDTNRDWFDEDCDSETGPNAQYRKYQAIYRIDDGHLEIRIFNCSLDEKVIINKLMLVQKSVTLSPIIKCKNLKEIPFVEPKYKETKAKIVPDVIQFNNRRAPNTYLYYN